MKKSWYKKNNYYFKQFLIINLISKKISCNFLMPNILLNSATFFLIGLLWSFSWSYNKYKMVRKSSKVRKLENKKWNHIFVSQWNHTKFVSNERGNHYGSISELFSGKQCKKRQFNTHVRGHKQRHKFNSYNE